MERVADPEVVRGIGARVRYLSQHVPSFDGVLHGTTGSPEVDRALDAYVASLRARLRETADGLGDLADAAVATADTFEQTDRRLAAP